MPSLFNQKISATYSGLLKTTSNGVLSPTLAQITDGNGNGSQLYLSTSKINFYNAYEFPTNDGSANQVLKTDGSGVLTWEDDANTGGVQVSGTPTLNQIAIWTDATTIKGMSALEIDVNDKITLTQGTNNYYIGGGNLANNNGEGNVGLGNDVFRVQTSGNFNIGIGNFAFYDFLTGVRNIGIGYNSFSNTTGCSSNVGVGASTLAYSTGDNNTALGDSALGGASFTGANNTAIGVDSGKDITTGSNNVILGSNTGNTITTSSNNIIISDGSGNNRIQVDSGGNVGVGTAPSDWKSTWKALNIGQSVGLFSQDNNTTGLSSNVIFDGTSWKNKNIGATAFYQQSEGAHYFYGNGSSTDAAATPFSPTTRLTISSEGNVGIGGTPPSITGYTALSINNGTNGAILDLEQGDAMKARFIATSTTATIETASGIPFAIDVNGNGSSDLSISSVGTATFNRSPMTTEASYDYQNIKVTSGFSTGYTNSRIQSLLAGYDASYYGVDVGYAYNGVGYNLIFSTNDNLSGNPIERLTISSTGAATFNSSVQSLIQLKSSLEFVSIDFFKANGTTKNYEISSNGTTTGTTAESLYFYRGGYRMILNSGGALSTTTGSLGTISSDLRLKKNVTDATSKLDDILSLRVVNFEYKNEDKNGKQLGFIAQEFEKVFPSLVTNADSRKYDTKGNVISGYEDEKGLKVGLDFAVFTKAIQEQQTIIEDLKARIEKLEG